MTPEERAIMITEKFSCHRAMRQGNMAIEDICEYIEREILEAIAQARAEAIEECARRLDREAKVYRNLAHHEEADVTYCIGKAEVLEQMAAAIRALTSSEGDR